MANELMQAALAYEAKGYSVIPLKPKDKLPLIPSWSPYQLERADRAQIGEWWRTWPNANIGIITGAISGGVYVIDADSPDAATAIKPILGAMDDVGIVATGKGFHLYYSHAGETLNNKAGIRQQIDFRGDAGYVVAPPSIHSSGRHYEWVKPINGQLRQLPDEFIKLLKGEAQTNGYKQRFDTAAALNGIPEGQRDQAIFKLAAKLRGADVPYEVAIELCEQAAANCVPPFREARRKVDQAYKYSPGRQQPAQETFWPEPITAQQLIDLPPDMTRWVWQECLPLRATSALIAKPYTGKSTFAASLALAVARGMDFLGRSTHQGAVLYVYLDGPQDELKENLLKIGICGTDPILSYAGRKPTQVVQWVEHVCKSNDVRLVIIDTAQKFFGFKEDRYEEKINAMQPMLDLANELNFHAMFTYHAAKNSVNSVSALGSIASEANVRTSLYLRKLDGAENRIFDTQQNAGKAFSAIGLSDPQDGFLRSTGTLFEIELAALGTEILRVIQEQPGIMEIDIKNEVQGRGQLKGMAIRKLLDSGQIERTGSGKKGDARKYFKAGSILQTDEKQSKIVDLFAKPRGSN